MPDLAPSAIVIEYVDQRKICEVPVESTSLASRNATQNGIMLMRWTDPKRDSEHRAWAKELQNKWKATFDKNEKENGNGGVDVPQYINYAERKSQFVFFQQLEVYI